MKTRIVQFLTFSIIILISCTLQAQQVFEQTSNVYNNIQRYSLNGSYFYSFGPSNHLYAGFQDDELYDQNMFRMRYSWNLSSIPSNATIQSAELTLQGIYTSNYPANYTQTWVYIKKYESNFTDYSSTSWDYMTTAQTLSSQNIPRTITNFNFTKSFSSGDDFCTYVKSKFGGNLYLGITADESIFSEHSTNVLDFYNGQVKIKIIYTVPATNVTFFSDNNFTDAGNTNHGSMLIDGQTQTIPSAGYSITRLTGTSINLGAISPQNNNQNHQVIWHTGTTVPSDWRRDGGFRSFSQNYPFTVQSDDNGKRYVANLRKNYLINRINQTEFDGNQTLPGYIVEQNSGQISTQGNGYTPGTIPYNFVYWTDNLSTSTTRSITPTDNQSYTALYKYVNHANQTNAFTGNSQKKVVRTADGRLHKVYESMSKVWYEVSTNNGSTWTIGNNGKPLSVNESKLPSIDFYGNSYIFIVWQEKIDDTYKIKLAHLGFPAVQFIVSDVYDDSWNPLALPYTFNTTPVVAWENNKILVAWRDNYGLNYQFGNIDPYGPLTWYTGDPFTGVTGSDANSSNPTICIRKDGGTVVFHLGWQQSTTSIKYCTLTPNAQNVIAQSIIETPSTGDGFNYRINPSISIKSDGYPTMVWVGAIYQGATTQVTKRSRISSGWTSTFGKYGSNVSSPTEYNSIITWSESNANKLYRPWSSIRTLSTSGNSIHLTNSVSNTQYAVTYRQYSPYDFQTSPDVLSLAKQNNIVNQCGREGIVRKGEAEFYFILGDVLVNDEIIKFVNIPDSIVEITDQQLNSYMETNPFTINSSSNFYFSLGYGSPDTVKALTELQGNYNLNHCVELVDAVTNDVLAIVNNIITNETNISIGEIISYQVNTQSIGERTVKIRIVTNNNFIGAFSLADILAEDNILGKKNYEQLELSNVGVKEYALDQNYPNPFNPSTIIVFQLPSEGLVTLKVYDILGNEVAILINEQKPQGRYEVNFNASNLASGVYIYKLQAGDFVSSKKMILIK